MLKHNEAKPLQGGISVNNYVLSFSEIDKTQLLTVGGKGANLGELSRITGVRVPDGFCITTNGYLRIVNENTSLKEYFDKLSMLKVKDRATIGELSAKIRKIIENTPIPADIEKEVAEQIAKIGVSNAYVVRSSATAEDLPTASFAGQQDTYLNIIGLSSIYKHICKCWASLFTDRAVTYRILNGFDHQKVQLSVVIQKMVFPESSGIMFTADPVSGNRKISSIDAGFGLGEALVSGLIDPDIYKVKEKAIIDKKVSIKKQAIYGLKEGGTVKQELEPHKQKEQVLSDTQILLLEETGRKIEEHFNKPQDIEWCISDGLIHIVQSRPITTLFPAPEKRDGKPRVYLSMSHQQMMTDAIKPLGIDVFRIGFDMTGGAALIGVGGRIYMDVTHDLASPIGRGIMIKGIGSADVLIQKALKRVVARKEYIKTLPRGKTTYNMSGAMGKAMFRGMLEMQQILKAKNLDILIRWVADAKENLKNTKSEIVKVSGSSLFDYILDDMRKMVEITVYNGYGVGLASLYAKSKIDKNLKKWIGVENASDILSQAVPFNVTSEMGFDLLDVSDEIRKHQDVLSYFENAQDKSFFEDMLKVSGGTEASEAILSYLEKYGARCTGEIDITRTRWAEKPTILIPMILSNIKNFEPGAHEATLKRMNKEVETKTKEWLEKIHRLPGGRSKVKSLEKLIFVFRNYVGIREFPKYIMMNHYLLYKQVLLKQAEMLVQKGIIQYLEDIYYLNFKELGDVVRTGQLDYTLIANRKEDFFIYEKMTPPRVITSDGEIITSEYDKSDAPAGALCGIAVSSGVIEGRARVVLRMEEASLEEGDILVTAFTDPSWTPLFVSVKGLVTEIGGMMTHGAVIAREYGLPAVVGVENATKLIKDGQRIRVNGSGGFVEIID